MKITSLLTFDRGKSLFLPAHGRGVALPKAIKNLLKKRAGIWDLPELPGLGGPFDAHGAVALSQELAAIGVGAERGWYGVNGATGLLQAALFSMIRPGQSVLMPRNAHRSLIQACALSELTPVLFDLPFMTDRGHVGPPDQTWLQKVLEEISLEEIDIAGAVLVNPTYQGYASDLEPLVKMFHQQGWPVLVDEAHGAHFVHGVDMGLPASALSAGADLVVHSLHKSATGLIQTAVLWLQGNLVDPLAVERSISWLQTSSPSSLLLASCESALLEWKSTSGKRKLKKRINEARNIAARLLEKDVPLLQNQDPLKLILHSGKFGISGFEADSFLISRGVVAELPEPGCLTFCLGLASQKGLIRLLNKEWDCLFAAHPGRKPFKPFSTAPVPLLIAPEMSCGAAWRSESIRIVHLSDSAGYISAQLICPYPPGIPLLIPGEVLDQKRVEWLLEQQSLWPDHFSSQLRVVSKEAVTNL